MKKASIWIIDDDDWFRDMFSQYLVHNCRNVSVSSHRFDSWKHEADRDSSVCGADPPLYVFGGAGREYLMEKSVLDREKRTLFLYKAAKEREEGKQIRPEAMFVSKYISAAEITARIDSLLSDCQTGGSIISNRSSFFVISITSSSGGLGKTAISLTMARLLRQKRNKIPFIISMSLLNDVEKYFPVSRENEYKTLNEYIYHLFAGDQPEKSLSSYLVKDRFDVCTFCIKEGISELYGLNREEMESFIDSLRQSQAFDYLIFDLDNSNDSITAFIAEYSDIMLVLSSPDEDAGRITSEWTANILRNCRDEPAVIRKIVTMEGKDCRKLKFFDRPEQSESRYGRRYDQLSDQIDGIRQENGDEILLKIPYDPDSFYYSEGLRQISMTGNFAAAVDNIMKEVIPVA